MPELLVVLVFFVATLVRATLGFGDILISVPVLALWMPLEQAVPTAVLISVTAGFIMLLRDWKHVHFRSAGRLTLFTCIGIPLGILFLRQIPEEWGKGLLAAIIVGYSVYAMRSHRAQLHDGKMEWLFGIQAGVLGGAYGMNGPPVVIYGTMRGWTPDQFRATLQAYFLPANIASMIGYAIAGRWTHAVTRAYVVSLPGVLLAIVLGYLLHGRLDAKRFPQYVYLTLIGVGAVLLVQAILA